VPLFNCRWPDSTLCGIALATLHRHSRLQMTNYENFSLTYEYLALPIHDLCSSLNYFPSQKMRHERSVISEAGA
jgi:hypothetical protein